MGRSKCETCGNLVNSLYVFHGESGKKRVRVGELCPQCGASITIK